MPLLGSAKDEMKEISHPVTSVTRDGILSDFFSQLMLLIIRGGIRGGAGLASPLRAESSGIHGR